MRRGERRDGPLAEDPSRVVDEELAFHLEERAGELIAAGLEPEEARARARRDFGDVEATRAYCERQVRRRVRTTRLRAAGVALLETLRSAGRGVLRRPRAVAAPVLVLAVAVTLNALAFTVVRGVLLAPLPFEAPERTFVAEEVRPEGGLQRASFPVLDRWRREAASVEAVAGYMDNAFPLLTRDGPVHVSGAAVTEGFLHLIENPLLMGRHFTPGEHVEGAARVALISEGLWRSALGGSPDVLDVPLRMNGESYTVVGVVRRDAAFPDGAQLWVPLVPTYPALAGIKGAKVVITLVRTRPGVERAELERELGRIATEVDGGTSAARADAVADELLGDVRTPLLLLQAAVLLVLLAACANAGGMWLTRSVRRAPELAVRISLGAGRARVAAALLVEGLALGVVAGVIGLGLASLLLEPALALVPRELPRAGTLRIDATVAIVALALATLTGVLTAVAPAVSGARVVPAGLIRTTSGSTGGPPWLRRALEGLVVGQVAMAVLLTAGAGLLLRSFVAAVSEDPGFDPARVTMVEVSLPGYAYPATEDRVAFARELLARAGGLPGAEHVALGQNLPITGSNMTSPLEVEGASGVTSAVQLATVTAGYFDVLRIPIVEGGTFSGGDRVDAPPELLVDGTVRTPDGRAVALGDRAESFFAPRVPSTVVGIVGSVRHSDLREAPATVVYRPFFRSGAPSAFTLLVRSDAPSGTVASAAQALIRELDPDLPADRVSTMSSTIRRSLAEPRFYTVVLSVFGGLALLLALAGCQAGLAHRVAQRRRELGLRLALGASAHVLRRTVRARGLLLTLLGAGLGLAAAVPASRALRSQLYGVEPADPVTYIGLLVVLLLAAAVTSDVPARRVTRLDPAESLRET